MTLVLVRKLLRDVRLALLLICLLLLLFQTLWAKITQRIVEEVLPQVLKEIPLSVLLNILFKGPGKIIETLAGGERINLTQAYDMLTIGYVHPLVQTIFCVWAVGRAAGAVAGELDRGTMELLLAQPVPRRQIVVAHFLVDLITIPLICLSLWAGNWLGAAWFGQIDGQAPLTVRELRVNPLRLAPALAQAAALLFALSGATMWLSARGRFRWRVLGTAVFLVLAQFLLNVLGQLWDAAAVLRPLTVFYYYQPQQAILAGKWTVDLGVWNGGKPLAHVPGVAVLLGLGLIGYALALRTFTRRDLPAPL